MATLTHSIGKNGLLYIKVPENQALLSGETQEITLNLPESHAGMYLKIEIFYPTKSNDRPIQNACSEKNCGSCFNHNCIVKCGCAELIDMPSIGNDSAEEPEEDNRPTIPGHPNCHYGDCYKECHVTSCAIHQGFEEIPEYVPNADK